MELETKLHFINDLQLKNISRELNYDVIIEKTEEWILCRDNHQENRLDNMNEITIKALSPDLEKDYFDFFDNRAFSDGSPY
ncbi:MAG: hypothetical protein VZR53_16795, partial [Prevotella sp.]|nr:hypothetical protein [Prevotella sp.]